MALILEPRWKSYVVVTTKPVLTPEQCDEVIRLGQSAPNEQAKIGTGTSADSKNKNRYDTKMRVTTIGWIPFDQGSPMYSIIEHWMRNTNVNHFGFEGMQITENAQYTEYPKGGFYEWHVDNELVMEHMPPVRKISMTLLLSDPKDFEGGELELIDDKKRPNLKRGYAIFFASFIRHRVKPIIKGNRKSLVMWFGGPPLK
jgi:PKHD-type hydroxylase